MKTELKLLNVSIQNIVKLVEEVSVDDLNKIPEGFANNLIWNVAHLVVTQKLLIYGLSGNSLNLEADFVTNYRKGTAPTTTLSSEECATIILQFKTQFEELQADLNTAIFKNYNPYPTSYNFEIASLEDAITFNNLHYGLHFSTMLRLKKSL